MAQKAQPIAQPACELTQTMYFSSLYYLCADVGSLSVGFFTLWLSRRGVSVFESRMRALLICGVLTLLIGVALIHLS